MSDDYEDRGGDDMRGGWGELYRAWVPIIFVVCVFWIAATWVISTLHLDTLWSFLT